MDAQLNADEEANINHDYDHAQDGEDGGDAADKKAATKKRTKTGCLSEFRWPRDESTSR